MAITNPPTASHGIFINVLFIVAVMTGNKLHSSIGISSHVQFILRTGYIFLPANNLDMQSETKLILIKIIHTLVWLFFNVVIFYMLYAVIVNKIDNWLWIGYGLICLEVITLVIFKLFCPLTLMARKYSKSTKDNFDIYLPNWLAKYNKLIYTFIMILIGILTIFRLLD